MWLLRTVSVPYLRRHRLRTSLTVIGIAAGVATMIATGMVCDSVFSSFASTVDSAMGGADLRVTASGLGLSEDMAEELRALPTLSEVGPVVDGFVSLSAGGELAVIGIDVLADPRSAAKVRSKIIDIPDELAFLTEPGAAVLPVPLAAELGLSIGSRLPVGCPRGTCELVVRGTMPGGGLAAHFGGRVAVMDLAAAQDLLSKPGRIDHVDVWLRDGVDLERAIAGISTALAGRAWADKGEAAEERAKQLLMAIRVFLTMAAFVAVAVGFFIVYHTVAASIQQRRQHLAVLNALGVSRRALSVWLVTEAVVLAAIATAAGAAAGVLAARVALAFFGTVTSAWVPVAAPHPVLTLQTAALAAGLAMATVLGATILACSSLFRRSTAQQLSSVQVHLARPAHSRLPLAAAALCMAIAVVLVAVAPATLPYGSLVTYVLVVVAAVLLAFGLSAPVFVHALAAGLLWAARRRPGIVLVLAASNVTRNPGSFIVVVTTMVMALGSTLASVSLTASLRHSGLTWLTEHHRGDIVLTAEGAFLRILTAPPIDKEVVEDAGALPGVAAVQGVRALEVRHGGHPAVLLAFDRASEGFTLYDNEWEAVAAAFWHGEGVLVSDNLARMREIEAGQTIELPSPSGPQRLHVLGTFPDYTGGSQLGSIAIAREAYRRIWRDDRVNRIQVWVEPGREPSVIARSLTERYLAEHGLRGLTLDEVRGQITAFIDDAFAVMYALVAVSLFVSFVGVVNFLLTVLADRGQEMTALRGIGVAPEQSFASIVAEGGLVGVVGAVMGVAAGFAISAVIVFHSVPMVTGWRFLFVFPLLPAILLAAGAVGLSAAAGLPSGMTALRWRAQPEENAA